VRRTSEEVAQLQRTKSPREAARLERKLAAKEEAALSEWAEKQRLILDGTEFERNWQQFAWEVGEDAARGAEHEIYPDGAGFFIKRNPATGQAAEVGGMHRTWLDYLNRLWIHKQLFPDTAYELIGFNRDPVGKLFAVVKQRAIRGDPAVRAEVEAYMKKFGFKRFHHDEYYSQEKGIVIGDLHDENAVKLRDGTIVAFDPVIEVVKPTDFEAPTEASALAAAICTANSHRQYSLTLAK
jgi:Serine/Threonine/Tyrosine Kinase found in polyvalent proteins